MKCRYPETDLALYVEGDLTPVRACEIQAHLSICTHCRDLVAELHESQAALKTLRHETASVAALSLVRNRVLVEIGLLRPRAAWGRWVYAIAGGVFVVVIGIVLAGYMREPERVRIQSVGETQPAPPMAVPLTETSPEPAKAQLKPKVRQRRRAPHVAVRNEMPAEPPKQTLVKLLTDDPNIVIYWLIDQTGGSL